MLFEHIDYLDEDFKVVRDAFIATNGELISYVGKERPLGDFGDTYDGRGKILLPGFVNAHTHIPMVLLRGYAENLPLHDWLNDSVWPFEAKLSDERVEGAIRLAIAEMLRFGTTSFSDMYYQSFTRARLVAETGIKANLCEGVISFGETDYPALAQAPVVERFIDEFHNSADGRCKVDLCIHAEYTNSPEVIEAVGDMAFAHGLNTQIHLSETRSEHEECKGRHGGMSPAQLFDSLGFFRSPCTAAHCVWTEQADWEIMAEKGVTAALNPISNMKLASGFAPVSGLLDANVNIALGTDGCASNNNLNIAQDMMAYALLYKGNEGDPTLVTPAQALYAATRGGALAQGRGDCGLVKEGMRADLAVRRADVPWMVPAFNVPSNLVYASQGSDTVLTMVDGKVLYQDGTYPTIDVEKAMADTRQAFGEILAEL